jgi:hypothetical protein
VERTIADRDALFSTMLDKSRKRDFTLSKKTTVNAIGLQHLTKALIGGRQVWSSE